MTRIQTLAYVLLYPEMTRYENTASAMVWSNAGHIIVTRSINLWFDCVAAITEAVSMELCQTSTVASISSPSLTTLLCMEATLLPSDCAFRTSILNADWWSVMLTWWGWRYSQLFNSEVDGSQQLSAVYWIRDQLIVRQYATVCKQTHVTEHASPWPRRPVVASKHRQATWVG